MITIRARRGHRATAALTGLAAAALTMTACGTPSGPAADSGKLKIVASTNVWGSVAQAIGGDDVEVEALIDDPAADPHSYESTPQDAAKVSDADLLVFNGGGYDEFVTQILSNAGQGKPTVQAVQGERGHQETPPAPQEQNQPAPEPEHGHEQGHAQPEQGHAQPEQGHDHSVNEHVWYDLHMAGEVADRIANELARIKPDRAQAFHESAERFGGEVDRLEGRVEQIGAQHPGQKVIVTEPVAHYLVEQAKLQDITPQSFVNAVDSGNDPAAAAVAEIHNAVRSRQAAAVVYNPQTESPVTEGVRTIAEQNQIPIVEMTETLPEGRSYAQWMDAQISALETALNRKP